MQLTQNLGAYSNLLGLQNSIDGRNCTVHEIFPSNLRRDHSGTQSLYVLWKNPLFAFVTARGLELDDSRLLGANQFVCHTAPADFACDERVHKICYVKEREKDC